MLGIPVNCAIFSFSSLSPSFAFVKSSSAWFNCTCTRKTSFLYIIPALYELVKSFNNSVNNALYLLASSTLLFTFIICQYVVSTFKSTSLSVSSFCEVYKSTAVELICLAVFILPPA